ncbi:MAG TPA: hypothetical protein PKE51_12375 [Gemmatimonadaceae bacterium]|nr:hypothetical protein [Gemmatimonadaceae bacterium]
MRHRLLTLALLACPLGTACRPGTSARPAVAAAPATPQQASPMMETTRAHERLTARTLRGDTLSFVGPGGRPVFLHVPPDVATADSLRLVVHFFGAAWLPAQAIDALGDDHIAVVVNLGGGSGIYHRTFADPSAFPALLDSVRARVAQRTGRSAPMARATLTAFSAGHGAVRVILREPALAERVGAVLLLDGLHTSYVPEGRTLADGGVLDSTNLVALRDFARRAMRGETRLLITHSTIFPGTYASTTETADWLLVSLGLRRTAVLQWGPRGMQQLSAVRSGGFEMRGYAGNTAPDHIDQLHAMPELLAALLDR